MIAMDETYYVTITVDRMTVEQAQKLLDVAIELNGHSRAGITMSYSEPI